MKLSIESTQRLVKLDGVECRLWRGTTPSGNHVNVYVHRIEVDALAAMFEQVDKELLGDGLLETSAPKELTRS